MWNVPWPVCTHAIPLRMLRLPRFMMTNIYIAMKPLWKVVQIVRKTWVWVAKDKSNTDCQSGSQQARVNRESNHENVISA